MNDISAIVLCGTPDEFTNDIILVKSDQLEDGIMACEIARTRYCDSDDPDFYYYGWNDYVEEELHNSKVLYSMICYEDFVEMAGIDSEFVENLYNGYVAFLKQNVDQLVFCH